jgi:signal transduction histidine kinase/CheY-like chemotaxis protein
MESVVSWHTLRNQLLKVWQSPAWLQFGVSVFSVALVVFIRSVSPGEPLQPFRFFTLAVAISAFVGGFGPGVAASVLALCAGAVLSRAPGGALAPTYLSSVPVTIGTWTVICLLCGFMRREAMATESTRAELDAMSRRLILVLDSMSDSCYVVDCDWQLQFSNQAMKLADEAPWDIRAAFNAEDVRALSAAMEDGSPRFLDIQRGQRSVHVRAFPLQDGLLVFEHDVTEENRVKNLRAAMLHPEGEARRQAEEAARDKDVFLHVISHELRTPLTTILGWTEILGEISNGEEPLTKGVAAITRSAKIQAGLIDQLLDLAELARTDHALEMDVFDLRDVMEDAIAASEASFGQAHQTVAREFEDASLLVRGDYGCLLKAISAVVDNATRYTPSEGTITFRLGRRDSYIVAEVVDTGIGIDRDFLSSIFDRFKQREPTMQRQYHGLGLGLTLAKANIDMNGGLLEITSEGTGKGTVAKLSLPMAPFSKSDVMTAGATSRSPLEVLSSARVLVVDDDPGTREVLAHFLRSLGADVRLASSGREAIDVATREPLNVIISDVGMPDMSGIQMIEVLRREKKTAQLPVIALSAYNRSDVRQMCFDAGFDDFASKPIERAVLLDKVSRLVANPRRPLPTND